MEQQLKLSDTVQNAQSKLSDKKEVTATEIVNTVLELHPEYGSNSHHYTSGSTNKGQRKSFDQWLLDVGDLFDEKRVQEIHGRLVILGLVLLDENIKHQKNTTGR